MSKQINVSSDSSKAAAVELFLSGSFTTRSALRKVLVENGMKEGTADYYARNVVAGAWIVDATVQPVQIEEGAKLEEVTAEPAVNAWAWPKGQPVAKEPSKKDRAIAIVNIESPEARRIDQIKRFMDETGCSKFMAATYIQNVRSGKWV